MVPGRNVYSEGTPAPACRCGTTKRGESALVAFNLLLVGEERQGLAGDVERDSANGLGDLGVTFSTGAVPRGP